MKFTIFSLTLFILALLPNKINAATHFTIKGSSADNNLGLSNQDSKSVSLSVATDLGNHLRIGVTSRLSFISMEGYRYSKNVRLYYYIRENTRATANSLDLTVIFYYGSIFTPYMQIGLVKKDYIINSFLTKDDSGELTPVNYSQPIAPNLGLGLGVRINNNFSLNLSYSVSPGIKQSTPLEESKEVLDSYSSIGFTYKL